MNYKKRNKLNSKNCKGKAYFFFLYKAEVGGEKINTNKHVFGIFRLLSLCIELKKLKKYTVAYEASNVEVVGMLVLLLPAGF